jgi:hypothetical protein
MEHTYWAVRCKTLACRGLMRLRYIGLYSGEGYVVRPSDCPEWLDVGCPICHSKHRYTVHDLEWFRTPEPPENGFVDKLRSALRQ